MSDAANKDGGFTDPTKARQARIEARRARIALRLRMNQESMDGQDPEMLARKNENDKQELSVSERQKAASMLKVKNQRKRGERQLKAIITAAEARENEQRNVEESRRAERQSRLMEESDSARVANSAINMQWRALEGINVPQELLEEIVKQRGSCDGVILGKDTIVGEYREELGGRDAAYVTDLKQQGDDISALIARMHDEVSKARVCYAEELLQIETALMAERRAQRDKNSVEVQELSEKRRSLEAKFLEDRIKTISRYESELDDIRIQDAENYNMLKRRLETETQTLGEQLQEMRATYQLNTEKLVYNFRVLSERDHENSHTIALQKRKISRLLDTLSSVISRYHREDKNFTQENIDLTEDYKRITEQFKDLQSKFRHFQIADQRRYDEVWSINDEEVRALVRKVLQADKIVHEQQLGLNWFPPSAAVFKGPTASGRGGSGSKEPRGGAPTTVVTAPGSGEAAEGGVSDGESLLLGGGSPSDAETLARLSDSQLVKDVLRLLVDHARFLIEDRLKGSGNDLVEVDAIFAALRIHTPRDVERLVGHFVNPGTTDTLIDADHVVRALQEFLNASNGNTGAPVSGVARELAAAEAGEGEDGEVGEDPEAGNDSGVSEERAAAVAAAAAGNSNIGAGGPSKDATEPPSGRSGGRNRREEREYWKRMSSVISERNVRVWSALEKALGKYHKLLKKRARLASSNEVLRAENEELKALLNQYLASDVNDALVVPPMDTLGLHELEVASRAVHY